MGFWKLLKISASSVKVQKELEGAIESNDKKKVKSMIGNYIGDALANGLSKAKFKKFQEIWNADQETLKERLMQAFLRGWMEGGGNTKFSKALSETLLEAELVIKENK